MPDPQHPRCGCGGEPTLHPAPLGRPWVACAACGTHTLGQADEADAWAVWGAAMGSQTAEDDDEIEEFEIDHSFLEQMAEIGRERIETMRRQAKIVPLIMGADGRPVVEIIQDGDVLLEYDSRHGFYSIMESSMEAEGLRLAAALTPEDRALLGLLDGKAKVWRMHGTQLGDELTQLLALVRRLVGEQP